MFVIIIHVNWYLSLCLKTIIIRVKVPHDWSPYLNSLSPIHLSNSLSNYKIWILFYLNFHKLTPCTHTIEPNAVKETIEDGQEKMELLVSAFSNSQQDQYEIFRRSTFPKSTIRKLMQGVCGSSVPQNAVIAMAGIAKVHCTNTKLIPAHCCFDFILEREKIGKAQLILVM